MVDLSSRSVLRVYLLTLAGTAICIALAFAIDGYSKGWHWSRTWMNNIIIPMVIAPPFFYFLLSKLRELSLAHEDLSLAHEELLRVASRDHLTDCLNRRAFSTLVTAYMEKLDAPDARRKGALLLLDVDHFKSVNDLFGHDEGDRALILIADLLRSNVRDADLVSRLGGEEFGVFLPYTDEPSTRFVAERIRKAVQDAWFAPNGARHHLSEHRWRHIRSTNSLRAAVSRRRPTTLPGEALRSQSDPDRRQFLDAAIGRLQPTTA